MPSDPVSLSAEFLLAVRRGKTDTALADDLAALDEASLESALATDGAKLAFWINVYNAAAQRALAKDPTQYDSRQAFFTAPLVTVAENDLSLDEIEHEILRRSYSKFTIGYLRRPGLLRDEFCESHALASRDPRVHFALNCGAASCPPIAAYRAEDIDAQLDMATRGYLDQTVEYDPDAGSAVRSALFSRDRAIVPRVMLWFRGDFGGKSGIHDVLRAYDQIPEDAAPRLGYRAWDWGLQQGDFADSEYSPVDEPLEG